MEEVKINKLDMKTENIVDANIEKIGALFPNVIVESENGKSIDFDLLKQELSEEIVEGNKERYQLTWPGKKEAIVLANTPTTKTLRPVKEKSVDFENTKNIYIEGDNLEALKILQESYLNKIKCIYIDPPYNTGNDFIYNDNFIKNAKEELEESGQIDEYNNRLITNNESNGRYHSDWLSMMYMRLRRARTLMSEDGVIFISIDDNEVENLKKICSEIFGQENFVGMLSVENNPKGRKNSSFISVSSEYCLIFAKDKSKSYFVENVPKKSSDMSLDENGKYVHNSGKRVLVGENSFNNLVTLATSDKNYSVYFREKDYSIIIRKELYSEIDQSLLADGYEKYYSHYRGKLIENTYTEEKFLELFNERKLDFANGKIYEKNFSDTIRMKSQLVNKEYEAIVRGEKTKFSMELTTTGAGTYLKELFELSEVPFTAPKNTGFLKMIISLFEEKDFCVLDFFSGSASSADAVMQLNAQDNGARKFIMIQMPELCEENGVAYKASYKTICDLGEERIRRAGKRLKEETNADIDYGFRVYKIDNSNMKDIYYEPNNLKQGQLKMLESNIKDGRTAEDLLTQVILDLGLTLDLKIEQKDILGNNVYFVADNSLVACFDNNVNINILDEICKIKPLKVVFKEESFNSDKDKINTYERIKKLSPESEVSVI